MELANIKKNVRITRGVTRGLKFKHDELVDPLKELENIKKRKKVQSDSPKLKRSFSREALSLYS